MKHPSLFALGLVKTDAAWYRQKAAALRAERRAIRSAAYGFPTVIIEVDASFVGGIMDDLTRAARLSAEELRRFRNTAAGLCPPGSDPKEGAAIDDRDWRDGLPSWLGVVIFGALLLLGTVLTAQPPTRLVWDYGDSLGTCLNTFVCGSDTAITIPTGSNPATVTGTNTIAPGVVVCPDSSGAFISATGWPAIPDTNVRLAASTVSFLDGYQLDTLSITVRGFGFVRVFWRPSEVMPWSVVIDEPLTPFWERHVVTPGVCVGIEPGNVLAFSQWGVVAYGAGAEMDVDRVSMFWSECLLTGIEDHEPRPGRCVPGPVVDVLGRPAKSPAAGIFFAYGAKHAVIR